MPQGTRFICFNGRFIKEDHFKIDQHNRAFKYADGFFETMHYGFGKVQLYKEHSKRIALAMQMLKMKSNILSQPSLLHEEITHLINANHYFKGGRIRLSVFRSGVGLYKPEKQEASYLIESSPLKNDNYPINTKGIKIGLYKDIPRSKTIFNQFKIIGTPISILASIQMGNNDDMFILNEHNQIIESTHSNAFFIKGETIYTPTLNSGCLHGIMRKKTLSVLKNSRFNLVETDNITENDITNFDEIFLSNAIRGIQWIGAYQTKRYDYKITQIINQMLTRSILEE